MTAINLLARGYRLEVSADGATNWLRLGGLNDLNDTITPNKQDSSNYDSDGWEAKEITMQGWQVTAKYNRQADSGVEDPASALLRACRGQFGDAARVYVRWYSKTQTSEPAWQGRAIVEINKSKTGVADLNEMQVTFDGDGALASIANPYAPTVAPVITSASPQDASAGQQVTISGQNFAGTVPTTGVKFGAVNASSWVLLGDTTLVAVVPAGTAGSAPITVTNATGTSSAFPYTRGS